MSDKDTIRLCLLGCGTVGTGVMRILEAHRAEIRSRLGVPLEVAHVVVRDPTQSRDPSVPRDRLTDDAAMAIQDPNVDLVVEVMGGVTVARDLVLSALQAGKPVITANKALLAEHGESVFAAARTAGAEVLFEAAVGGGMPVIRALREGLASDRVTTIQAIINGTSNYILSAMTRDGVAYADALRDAQERGYAESDPSMDVDGIDAAQKLSILVSVAFATPLPYREIPTAGIGNVTAMDISFAGSFGYTIKPLAVARLDDKGVRARVGPSLLPASCTLANVHGAYNAVRCSSAALGPLLVSGQGAGMMPTASAVVSDIIDGARNLIHGSVGRVPTPSLGTEMSPAPDCTGDTPASFYLRLPVEDEPGVLGAVAACIGAQGVSISRVIQEAPRQDGHVQIVLLTHETTFAALEAAIASLEDSALLRSPPCVMPIEGLE